MVEPKKILIVDDEAEITEMLKAELTENHFDIFIANNGLEAINQVASQRPDLVVLDIMMPKMTGSEVLRALRTSTAQYNQIPVVAMSAKESMQPYVFEWSSTDFLLKPFQIEDLLSCIEHAFEAQTANLPAPSQLKLNSVSPITETFRRLRMKKFLLAGDDEHVLRGVQEFLAEYGCDSSRVSDLEGALISFQMDQPGVVLCQFTTDQNLFGVGEIVTALKNATTKRIDFCFCCPTRVSSGMVKALKGIRVVSYDNLKDLTDQLGSMYLNEKDTNSGC